MGADYTSPLWFKFSTKLPFWELMVRFARVRWLLACAAAISVARAAVGDPAPLGVQRCNTGCQTRFTDCIDRCDGARKCQAACQRRVESCVKACVSGKDADKGPAPERGKKAKPGEKK